MLLGLGLKISYALQAGIKVLVSPEVYGIVLPDTAAPMLKRINLSSPV